MSIVYKIINKVKRELTSNRNDVSCAIFVASYYLNVEMTHDELKEIILFSNKIDQRECPNFKSIYSQEVNNALWSVVCWTVQSNNLIEEINRLLAIYTDLKIHLSLDFTFTKQWKMKVEKYGSRDINYRRLTSYSCADLFFETVDIIKEIQ